MVVVAIPGVTWALRKCYRRHDMGRLTVRVTLLVYTMLLFLSLTAAPQAWAGHDYIVIDESGKPLLTIFDGLKPIDLSRFEQAIRENRQSQGRAWKGIRPTFPGLKPVQGPIFGGGNCPSGTVCSGGFTSIIPSSDNCGGDRSCSVSDAITDLSAPCNAGEQSFYCETTAGACCLNAVGCTSHAC